MDRVISSYTPTLTALAEARRDDAAAPTRPAREQGHMLVVSVPELDDAESALPGVARSRDILATLFGPEHSTVLNGSAATVDAVLQAVPDHPWLHVGCHGNRDMTSLREGGLSLWDGRLTIAHLSDLNHPAGEFAFIGACQTAIPSSAVPDEMISLATALHHGGYRQVIGSLWTVGDAATSMIADEVYRHLVRDTRLYPREAAQALHNAVRRLRDEAPHLPSIWTHFTHLGP